MLHAGYLQIAMHVLLWQMTLCLLHSNYCSEEYGHRQGTSPNISFEALTYFQGILNPYDSLKLHFIMEVHIHKYQFKFITYLLISVKDISCIYSFFYIIQAFIISICNNCLTLLFKCLKIIYDFASKKCRSIL